MSDLNSGQYIGDAPASILVNVQIQSILINAAAKM